MSRYTLNLTDHKGTHSHKDFDSRKQAFVYVNAKMFMSDKYNSATLFDNVTGEIWLDIRWRGRDNYRRKRVWQLSYNIKGWLYNQSFLFTQNQPRTPSHERSATSRIHYIRNNRRLLLR